MTQLQNMITSSSVNWNWIIFWFNLHTDLYNEFTKTENVRDTLNQVTSPHEAPEYSTEHNLNIFVFSQ